MLIELLEGRVDFLRDKWMAVVNDRLGRSDGFNSVLSADPTDKKIYTSWIIKQLLDGNIQSDQLNAMSHVLAKYDQILKSLPINQRQINQLSYKELTDVVGAFTSNHTIYKTPKHERKGDVEVLAHGNTGTLYDIVSFVGAQEIARGTKWCTTKHSAYAKYIEHGEHLYVWVDTSSGKVQFHLGTAQFKDAQDEPLGHVQMTALVQNAPIRRIIMEYIATHIRNKRDKVQVKRLLLVTELYKDPELAELVEQLNDGTDDPYTYFLQGHVTGYNRQVDQVIAHEIKARADDAIEYVMLYTRSTNERLPISEQAMLASLTDFNIMCCTRYSTIINGPWRDFDDLIKSEVSTVSDKTFDHLRQYIRIHHRGDISWLLSEIQDDDIKRAKLYMFVNHDIDDALLHRLPLRLRVQYAAMRKKPLDLDTERQLFNNPSLLVDYIRGVYNHPREDWVQYISNDPDSLARYAAHVLKHRLTSQQERLLRPSHETMVYALKFNVRLPAADKYMLNTGDGNLAAEYAIKCIKGRWVDAERMIEHDHGAYVKKYHSLYTDGGTVSDIPF